jgi:hypothetical protein
MSDDVSAVRKVIGAEEHAWTAELRDALVKFGQDDPCGGSAGQAGADSRGRFGGSNGAREFVQTAPIGAQDKAKLAYLNAERLLLRRTA